MIHVLLVDDDLDLRQLVSDYLQRYGMRVSAVADAASLRRVLRAGLGGPDPFKVLLLDLMLPDGNGLDLFRWVREIAPLPVIMLTAQGDPASRVVGLELGADDYVVKPFSARELVARIRAILRRGAGTSRMGSITVGAITLDPGARTCTKNGDTVELAAKEFDLLHYLMANAGTVLRREDIMDEVWDPHWFGPTKTLDVHVSWLRKKIEDDPAAPVYIVTVRGVGFRFVSPDDL
jgi:two-component system OmpR family response regulator